MVRVAFHALVTASAFVAACQGSTSEQSYAVCSGEGPTCACYASGAPPQAGDTVACNPAAYPGTICCADTSWPGSGSCECITSAVACGIVPGYFEPAFDGGPTAGCVCTPGVDARPGQVLGATCEPGGWTSPPSTVGVCCYYPASLVGTVDDVCACSPSFNCEPGSTKVATCSAASFVSVPPMTCAGQKAVAACSAGGPSDGGADASDASMSADTTSPAPEAGVCGSGPPGMCNQIANVGMALTDTCAAGAPPSMTGGPITEGTYAMVSGTQYATSCSGFSPMPGGPTTFLFTAGCIQSIDATGGAHTATWSVSGNTLTSTEVCPVASPPSTAQYTATATTLSMATTQAGGTFVVGYQLVSGAGDP
jgi:hypothetical protein